MREPSRADCECGAANRRSIKSPVPILLAVRELDHGGIERDVTKLAMEIDRMRFQPHVASYQAAGMRFEELRGSRIPVLQLNVSSFKSPATLTAAATMWRYIRERKIRLVHAWDTSAAFVVPVARLSRVPAVLSSTLGSRDLLDSRTRTQIRWTDRMVDAVVVNCEAMRSHMIEDEHVSPERIELCYNGVDPDQFHPAPGPPLEPGTGALVIGSVCVLRPEKALHLLQEAFARVRRLRPGMKLLIVGSGPELARLQTNSRRLSIERDCLFVPATRQVPMYLRSLDIFVSCSLSEAFSNTLLEAMACGVCVVGSRVGGTPELIGNDERGLLFQNGDPGDLAGKLETLIENEALRRALASRAATFARSTFSMERAAARMAQIYESILERKAVGQIAHEAAPVLSHRLEP